MAIAIERGFVDGVHAVERGEVDVAIVTLAAFARARSTVAVRPTRSSSGP